MKLALSLVLLFSSSLALAENSEKVTAMYLNSEYSKSYQEKEYRIVGEVSPLSSWPAYIGFSNSHRQYDGGSDFDKNSLVLGTTWAPTGHKGYYDFATQFSDSDDIGAKYSVSLMAHSTYFTDWDLAVGVEHASYKTSDVFTIKPLVLYIHRYFELGHASWIFEDSGTHYAWRNFLRLHQGDVWQEELSISGGESREDIGLIDDFFAYSVSVKRKFKNFDVSVTGERYEGQIRSGLQWGVAGTWTF